MSTKDFTNKFEMMRAPGYPRLTTTYTSSSYPDRTLVYETVMQHPRAVIIEQYIKTEAVSIVMILNVRTERSVQTVHTQIRLLLEEQSDQGLHCLLFDLHVFDKYLQVWPFCLNFREITTKFSSV